MNQSAVQIGRGCELDKFPINASEAFKASTLETLRKVMQTVDWVDAPLTAEGLAQGGYRGMIKVSSEDFVARLGIASGFWSGTPRGDASMKVNVLIDGESDRLFGTSVSSARSINEADATGCDAAANATSKAISAMIKDALEQVAERISDAPKLRQPVVSTNIAN